MAQNSQNQFEQSGMTLVETLVALAVSGLIAGAIYSLFQTHQRIAIRQSQSALMQQELFSAISQISEELRMSGFSAQGASGPGFSHRPGTGAPDFGRTTTQTSVYCTQDVNGDGIINESGGGSLDEHSGFRLNVANNGSVKKIPDNVLRKYDTGAVHWQPLGTNIGDVRFTYLNAGGDIIPDPQTQARNIRGVRVEITAIPSPAYAAFGIGNRTASTMVWCRNAATEKIP